MVDAPPPSYSVSAPQILVTPLSDRSTFLGPTGDVVEGEVYVKGLGLSADGGTSSSHHGRRVESLSVRVVLHDILPGFPVIPLFESAASFLYQAQPRSSNLFPTSHTFSVTLRAEGMDGSTAGLPGCVHLAEHDLAGEVRYDLEVLLRLRNQAPGGSQHEEMVEEVRERQVIHITPRRGVAPPSSSGAPAAPSSSAESSTTRKVGALAPDTSSGPVEISKDFSKHDHGMRMRLLVSGKSVRVGEALPVGVELSNLDVGTISTDHLSTGSDPRGLRRVKLELWRRIRTPVPQPVTYGNEPGPSSLATSPPTFKDHLTLLWRSGKSCRYSSTQPIRLLFHLPPHPTAHPMGPTGSRSSGEVLCGEITQETPYHHVEFFVRAIAGFASSDQEVPLDQVLEVLPSDRYGEENGVVPPTPPPPAAAQDLDRDEVLAQQLSHEDLLPDDDESRREAYRLKGIDVVGEGGTYRPELPDVVQGSSSTAYHGASSSENPPPFSTDTLPPPFAAISRTTGTVASGSSVTVAQDAPTPSSPGLPTFQESQSQVIRDSAPPAHGPGTRLDPSSDPAERFTVRPATGELANWIEYDGYESFSQPPPPAAASLGLSSSIDLPPPGEDQAVDSPLVRNLLGDAANSSVTGVDDRMRLMTELGLGEGTRVIDMQGDMPPGIDEPSLPALPHAIMPHHIRNRQRSISHSAPDFDQDSLPNDGLASPLPTFSENGASGTHPPPSFAASEAAEAQGYPAGVPLHPNVLARAVNAERIVINGEEADASSRQSHTPDHPPPLYSTDQGCAPADLPPSYR